MQLQTEIATAVANALKVSLLQDASAQIAMGGTSNAEALDAYLSAKKTLYRPRDSQTVLTAIAGYSEARRLDPSYALAIAGRSAGYNYYAHHMATGPAIKENFEKAAMDARRAIALAPGLAEGHLMLAWYYEMTLDLVRAGEEYTRAVELAPRDARMLRFSGHFSVSAGRIEAGIAAVNEATLLDPLNPRSHYDFGFALFPARRYDEALGAFARAINLDPNDSVYHPGRGVAFYADGNLQAASASCENKADDPVIQLCLALTYEKLGRHTDAEATLKKVMNSRGDAEAVSYAEFYAQRGCDCVGAT